jgi:hypothetical protein
MPVKSVPATMLITSANSTAMNEPVAASTAETIPVITNTTAAAGISTEAWSI